MSSVDNRIVKMQFDNATFKKAATDTHKQLTDLDAAVAKAGKGKGLLDMAGHMDTVRVKAGAMQIAAVTAIANIANRAVNAGINIAKSLTIDPIKAGFDEYELKMKSIQTILSNTKGENLQTVTARLNELNEYSDKTIYNFGNMTTAIGKMTTAGIGLEDATAVVKGFHNMVALAGGDATAAAGAMEQFVYGLQAGKITALDWQSIATRGLGSQSLQKAFFETARAAGTLGDVPVGQTFEEWSKASGGFKGSLESGWLTSDVATKALKAMTGDVKTVQEMMALGFDEKTAKDMLEIAANAEESATKVRTFTSFMGTLREQLGSGWSQVMETIIGDFDEATELFTGWSNATGKVLGKMFGYIGRLLKGWDDLGGRAAQLKAFQHVLAPIASILGLIATAFKAAFGGTQTGKGLASFSKALEQVTRPLNILSKLIRGEITPLQALMRMFQWGGNIIEKFAGLVGKVVEPMLDMVGIKVPTDSGILGWLKDLGSAIKTAIEQVGDLIEKGMSLRDSLGSVDIKIPSLPDMPSIGGMFGGGEEKVGVAGLAASVQDLTGDLFGLSKASEDAYSTDMFNPDVDISAGRIRDMGDAVSDLTTEAEKVQTVGDKVGPIFDVLKDKVGEFIKGFSLEDLMASFNLAVLSTFMISVSRFFNTLSKSFEGFVGTGEAVNGILESTGDALGSFQTAARAKLILNIAIALAVLAASLWLLAQIPIEDLGKALGAMGILAVILKVSLGSMTEAIESLDGKNVSIRLVALGIALGALAVSILILAVAFRILGKVKWEDMLKGLLTIVVVMKLIQKLGELSEDSYKSLLSGAAAIAIVAGSMLILAGALLLFKLVDWESMGKAGAALAGITLAVGLLALIPYEGIAKVGVALLAASIGILALANALIIFGLVQWESIGKAAVMLGVLTIALAALAFVGNPVTISGVVGLSVAMIGLAAAALILNSVEWASIGKIAVILVALVAAFGLFMAVVYLAAPVLPLLSGLALSLALLAGGLALLTLAVAAILPLMAIGVGAFAAFATGAAVAIGVFLTTLALQAPIMKTSILKLLQVLIDGIVEAVPMVIDGIQRLWAAIMKEFQEPKKQGLMNNTGKSWIDKIKEGIQAKIPILVEKAKDLALRFIRALAEKAPLLGGEGAKFVAKFIQGVANNIGPVITAGANLIIKFIEGIARESVRIADAAATAVIKFTNELAATIRARSPEMGAAMGNLGVAMVQGLISGISSMVGEAIGSIVDLASDMIAAAKSKLKVFSPSRVFKSIGKFLVDGMTIGIQENAAAAINAVAAMVSGQIAIANEYVDNFIQKLDQKALAASAKAAGLARAAEKAQEAADDTKKNKKDDKSANKLSKEAEKAAKRAEKAEAKAERAKEAQDRADEYAEATTLDKAKMRSEDAQNQLDAARGAEFAAAQKIAQANALDEQAKARGVSKKDAKEMRKQADKLREQAKEDAKRANAEIAKSRASAADALTLQKQAGDEAAAEFQKQFDDEAKADADEAAFDKLTPAEKAAERRRQAEALQAKAAADLTEAKRLAYTDLEAANALAEDAMASAETAREYLAEAIQLETDPAQSTTGGGSVVNLDPTEAASIAFNRYSDMYDSATAAAASDRTVEFNQYNTSPESLDPSEVYRKTNNLLSHAVDKLQPAA